MTPLSIERLTVARRAGGAPLIAGLSLSVAAGEIVGLVGESGSGKSLTAQAAIGMLPTGLVQTGGVIRVDGVALEGLSARQLADLRRRRIALIFQDPMTALNPTRRVGAQMADVLAAAGCPRGERRSRTQALLADMELPEPAMLFERYPHQLSGGQRQRVLIAMAFAGDPAVVIADEVTTALDVSVRAQVLKLLVERARRAGSGLLFITHDLGAARHACDRILVMAGGRLVEEGRSDALFRSPMSAEARALLAALPERARPRERLPVPGEAA